MPVCLLLIILKQYTIVKAHRYSREIEIKIKKTNFQEWSFHFLTDLRNEKTKDRTVIQGCRLVTVVTSVYTIRGVFLEGCDFHFI